MPADNAMIAALQCPEPYAHPVEAITLFETHISWVLLTGEFAYKIKKPVNFGFLDFSTLEKRRFYCEEELRLNRRLAPQLYLDVVPICGTPEAPLVEGTGMAFEYAVKMRQFDPQQTFDELLKRDALTLALMKETASTLAEFHQRISVASPSNNFGTAATIEQPTQENFTQLAQALSGQPETDDIQQIVNTLHQWSQQQHNQLLNTFQQRKQDGFIRECHGDLHLRNIVLLETPSNKKVTPFDGIEFSTKLRWIDVMSELAFLLMDLDDHQQKKLSQQLLNKYLSLTGDYDGISTLRYYLVYRAMVRAKVAGLRLEQIDDKNDIADCLHEIRNYIQLAQNYTQPASVNLIITHGLSGSGKSYLANQLALDADLIHLRADVERKRLFGISETAHSDSSLNAGIYQKDATQATYQRLFTLAKGCLKSGFSVIVDATFLQRSQRDLFHSLAQELKCNFHIVDCQAETTLLQQRIQQRERQAIDASEATLAVLEKQCQHQQPLDTDERKYSLIINTAGNINASEILRQLTHP